MRLTRRRFGAIAAVTALAGCVGDDDGDGNGDDNGGDVETPTPMAEAVVEAHASQFTPRWVAIEVGGSVTFQHEAGAHSVTLYHEDNDTVHRAPDGAEAFDETFNSGTLEVDFDVEGVYTVFCRPHASMGMATGVVVGTPSADEPGLAAAQGELPSQMQGRINQISSDIRDAYGLEGMDSDGADDDDDDDDRGDPGY